MKQYLENHEIGSLQKFVIPFEFLHPDDS